MVKSFKMCYMLPAFVSQEPPKMVIRLLKIVVLLSVIIVLVGINTAVIFYYYFQKGLPEIYTIKDYMPLTTTDIFDRDGRPLYRIYNQRRTVVDIKRIPRHVINAFLAAEDADFFSHKGVDITTVLRAIFVNLTSGKIRQGGSTITQQVVKTFFLTPERRLSRKIKEMILSFRLEKYLTKEEILHLYLNQIYFGAGNYGIEEASRYFFSKPSEDLTVREAAFLASLVKAPEPFGALKNPERVRERQVHIIKQMEKNRFISSEDARKQIEEGLQFKIDDKELETSYAVSYAIKRLTEEIPVSKLYNGGFKVILTLDKEINDVIERELMEYLDEKNAENRQPLLSISESDFLQIELKIRNMIQEIREHYYKISKAFKSPDPLNNRQLGVRILKPYHDGISLNKYIDKYSKISPIQSGYIYLGVVTGCDGTATMIFTGESVISLPHQKNRRKGDPCVFKKGDVILYRAGADNTIKIANQPLIQGGVIMFDNHDEGILGMSGGYSYLLNEFNRATQARRQPGSSFKPIIYSYAIETGKYNITSIENDAPVEYIDPQTGNLYRPSNYDNDEYSGEITLLDAIAESKNTISVRLVLSLGLERVAEFINGLYLDCDVRPYPSVALGSFEITLLSLSRFYSALARGGSILKDKIIMSIKDESGRELYTPKREERQILLPETAFIITRMLKEVIRRGTGTAAAVDGLNIAGKTGTTNNYTNAWFIGYTPDITLGILIGRDDNRSMGRRATGGSFAAPLMKRILTTEDIRAKFQSTDFSSPGAIKFINVDIHTGKRCVEYNDDCEFLPYREGFEPPIEKADGIDTDIMRLDR